MRHSYLFRTAGIISLLLSTLFCYAQEKEVSAIQVDTLTKIIGIACTIGGFFIGYMQLRMANKIAEVEARFSKAIDEVKDKFATLLEKETEKLETKVQLSGKDIEAKMATRHDIDNIKTQIKMQHEIITLQMLGLKDQLLQAASLYKKDNIKG